MEPQLTAEESLAVLRENASRLASATRGLPARRLHTATGPDEWSPAEVLAHVRACADVWGGNIGKILAADHPTFAGVNPRTWITRTDYLQVPFEPAFSAFSKQRRELLRTLDGLQPADWERTATVMAYGQPNERTLGSYASKLARHERIHVQQIERTLAQTAKKRG